MKWQVDDVRRTGTDLRIYGMAKGKCAGVWGKLKKNSALI